MAVSVEEKVDLDNMVKQAWEFEKEGKLYRAKKLLCKVLEYNPKDAEILVLLGHLELRRRQFDNAIEFVKKAIEIKPCVEFYIELVKVYIEMEDSYNAILVSKEAIQFDFDNYYGWFYLAYSLKMNNQCDDAIIAYKRALEIKPDSASVYHNIGNIYNNVKNDTLTTIAYYEEFIKYHPEDQEAKGALGTLYLKAKNYEKGWEYLEFCENKALAIRDRNAAKNSPTKLKPIWKGEDLTDKIIYVYYDGGIGDTIMFSRFLPILKKRCKKIILRVQSCLVQLFKDSNLISDVFGDEQDESLLKFDYHIPIMSIPHKLKIHSEADIPFVEGYLKADEKKVEDYRKKYFDNDKFKIGIKWEGNTFYNQVRHLKLEVFNKLLDIPNIKLYSLQKGPGIEQLLGCEGNSIVDLGSVFEDFSDTAAAVENLDLVISIDTSVAHLAGGLNKQCWIMLPFAQDWRWSTDLSHCPWYNSVRFFKQKSLGDWGSVIAEVHRELLQKFV